MKLHYCNQQSSTQKLAKAGNLVSSHFSFSSKKMVSPFFGPRYLNGFEFCTLFSRKFGQFFRMRYLFSVFLSTFIPITILRLPWLINRLLETQQSAQRKKKIFAVKRNCRVSFITPRRCHENSLYYFFHTFLFGLLIISKFTQHETFEILLKTCVNMM